MEDFTGTHNPIKGPIHLLVMGKDIGDITTGTIQE